MKPLYTQEEFDRSVSGTKLPCECYECQRTFYKMKRDIIKVLKGLKPGFYCSSVCKGKGQDKRQSVTCINCKKPFLKRKYQVKTTNNNFCSKSCAASYNNRNKTHGTRRSQLEVYLEELLITTYPDLEFLFNKKETINAELDIHIPALALAFELNGIFHYEPIYGQDKLSHIQNNDHRKFQACLERGIELCIIDTSSMKNFKETKALKYFNIITSVINQRSALVS